MVKLKGESQALVSSPLRLHRDSNPSGLTVLTALVLMFPAPNDISLPSHRTLISVFICEGLFLYAHFRKPFENIFDSCARMPNLTVSKPTNVSQIPNEFRLLFLEFVYFVLEDFPVFVIIEFHFHH